MVDNTGKFLFKIGEPGKGDGQLRGPDRVCLQKCGNHHNLLVGNSLNGRVDQFTVEGCFTGKTVVKLQAPIRITTTPDGLILVTDFKTKKIHILKQLKSNRLDNQTNIHPEININKVKR